MHVYHKFFFFLFSFFLTNSSYLFAQNPELNRLIREVLAVNPELKALDQEIQAAVYNVSVQSSFQNPQLSVGISNLPADTYSLDREAMTQKIISIRQSIPLAGKRGIKNDIATEETELRRIQKANKEIMLIRQVKGLYYEYLYLDAVHRYLRDTGSILEMISGVARAKYQSGTGDQHDVLQTGLEMTQLEMRKLDAEKKTIELRGLLNTLLLRSAGEALNFSDSLQIVSFLYGAEELEGMILRGNPEWKAAVIVLEQLKVRERLARREYWPDAGVMLSYGQREERPDFLSASIAVDLPLFAFSKQTPEVRRSRASVRGQNYRKENLQIRLLNKSITMREQIETQYRICLLFRDNMVPQARQAYASALSAYTADRLDFTALMRSFMQLLQSEIEAEQAIRDYLLRIADLEVLAGQELNK